MLRSEKSWLVIEIGDHRIRATECRLTKGKTEAFRSFGADIVFRKEASGDLDFEHAACRTLRTLLESNAVRTRRAVLSIPRHLASVKFLKLASVDVHEIAQMARIESLRQLPYNEDEIIGAHRSIRVDGDGYTLVMIVSILRSVVDRFVSIVKPCGLVIEKILLSSEAFMSWFLENVPSGKDRNALLISAGPEVLEVQVLESGSLVFSRGVAIDMQKPNEDLWLKEVEASIAAYQSVSSARLQEIYFCGSQEMGIRLKPLFDEVSLPFRVIDAKEQAIASTLVSPINLLSEPLRHESERYNLQRSIAVLLLWATLASIFLGAALFKKDRDERLFLSLIDAEIKKNKPRIEAGAKMSRILSELKGQIGAKPLAVEVFTRVHSLVPEGIALDLLDYEDRDFLTLRGNASGASKVFDCAKALEKSEMFSAVRVRYVNKRIVNGQEAADFEIQASLSGESL